MFQSLIPMKYTHRRETYINIKWFFSLRQQIMYLGHYCMSTTNSLLLYFNFFKQEINCLNASHTITVQNFASTKDVTISLVTELQIQVLSLLSILDISQFTTACTECYKPSLVEKSFLSGVTAISCSLHQ